MGVEVIEYMGLFVAFASGYIISAISGWRELDQEQRKILKLENKCWDQQLLINDYVEHEDMARKYCQSADCMHNSTKKLRR